jgi:hypothetical protein
MRFMIMHKSSPQWEAGAIPGPDLIARVAALLGELGKARKLLGAEGLRATAEGVRVRFSSGTRSVVYGPFTGDHELPAGFSILRAPSLEAAIEWATRQAEVLGDGEVDIRPVTEPWDIGMAPKPEAVTTRRYMVLRKATSATEAGAAPTPEQRLALSRLIEETTRGTCGQLATETMRPSRRGRRYKNSRNGVSMFDGPFAESKELIAGYVIVSAESLDAAGGLVMKYLTAVEADEVDLRELE